MAQEELGVPFSRFNVLRMERFDNPLVYAVWHPDDLIRRESSSGGAFSLLAEAVIGHGGVLDATHVAYVKYGAAWLLESAFYCAVNCFAIISEAREKIKEN